MIGSLGVIETKFEQPAEYDVLDVAFPSSKLDWSRTYDYLPKDDHDYETLNHTSDSAYDKLTNQPFYDHASSQANLDSQQDSDFDNLTRTQRQQDEVPSFNFRIERTVLTDEVDETA